MVADVSAIAYFAPILSFLIVFVLMFALLTKTKVLGEEKFIHLFVSFLIATIFVTAASVRQLVLDVVPWFAVFIVALFFILILSGFMGKSDLIGKGVGWVFILLVIVLFVVSGIKIFSITFTPYLPGPSYGVGGDSNMLFFTDWIYSSRVLGAALLLGIAALVSWVLVKTK
jgi:hypothetical protein|tara:strand:- start:693 stop:1205 length:513 start_codon:yes stop_codon:yes gene_type:complete